VVLASALAVNLRMAMYSASLAPHLGKAPLWQRAFVAYFLVDQSYAVSSLRYDKAPEMSSVQKVAYFFGSVAPVAPVWYGFTLVGALVGQAIPPEFALDFAVPIAFLALIAPALRTPAHVAAAFVAIVGVLVFGWVPYNLGLLIAALLGMMAGAQVELLRERRA
jgi:predicted branched-subunit amino acid permease